MQLKRVLLIQRRSLGDALYTVLVSKVIKEKYPHVKVDFLTLPFAKQFFESYKYIDEVIPFLGFWNTLKTLRRKKYDVILDYEATFRTYSLVLLSGAKIRAAFYRKKREKFLYPIYNRLLPVHFSDFTYWDRLKLLEVLNIPFSDELKILPSWEVKKSFQSFYKNPFRGKEYIVISPKGVLPSKMLAPKVVAALVKEISQTFKGKIVISVAPNENTYIKELKMELPSNAHLFAKDLLEFAALLKEAKLLISIESFPYHLALLLRVPSIVIVQGYDIWFKNSFNLIYPYYPNLECIKCYIKKNCPYNFKCQTDINIKEIISKVLNILAKM